MIPLHLSQKRSSGMVEMMWFRNQPALGTNTNTNSRVCLDDSSALTKHRSLHKYFKVVDTFNAVFYNINIISDGNLFLYL